MEMDQKSRKNKRVPWVISGIAVLVLAVTAVMAGAKTASQEKSTLYAGSYGRGTDRYKEFKAFVKKYAVSTEKKNSSSQEQLEEKDAAVYTLNSKAVKMWGEPCNRNRFFLKREEFLNHLEQVGYVFEKMSEEENNTVEMQKYGAVKSSFLKRERYRLSEGVSMLLDSDLINEDVLAVKIYSEEVGGGSIAEGGADIFQILSKACSGDRSELIREFDQSLKNVIQKENIWSGEQCSDCASIFERGDDGQGVIYVIPAETMEGIPYYWP